MDTFDATQGQKAPVTNEGSVDVATEVLKDFHRAAKAGAIGAAICVQYGVTPYDMLIGFAIGLRAHINDQGKTAEEIEETSDHNIFTLVTRDIEDRVVAGEQKYGKRLQTNNGRNVAIDCYQEMLDAINYFKQGILEGVFLK